MVNVASNGNARVSARPDILQIHLQDEDGQNVLGIDDGALRQSLRIEMFNTSGRDLELQPVAENALNGNTYNFAVSFRPGTLVDISSITLRESTDGWKKQSNGNTLYFGVAEKTVIPQGGRMTLTLENISAAPEGGSRGTRVEIKYDQLLYQGSNETISGHRLQYLNIVNQRGKKQIPLYVGLLGSNTILNDGQENELTLTIQSLPNMSVPFVNLSSQEVSETLENSSITRVGSPANSTSVISLKEIQSGNIVPTEAQIADSIIVKPDDSKRTEGILKMRGANESTLDQATKFTISFDVAATASDAPQDWALLNTNDADEVRLSVESNQANWGFGGKETQGISPQWSYICQQGWQIAGRQELLRLKITNLKTLLKAGYANLYVHFENIPGYWDGYITVPIHKGPLVYREDSSGRVGCVGIGTDNPQAKLHVKPPSGVDGLKVEGNTEIAGNLSISGGNLSISGKLDFADGDNVRLTEAITITPDGKVGIGTENPQTTLDINGDIRVEPKPFQLKKFTGGDNAGIDTKFSSDRWVVIIAGFSPDVARSESYARAQRVFTFIDNGTWWIRANSIGTEETSWEINVLAIRKEWVEVISNI